MSKIEIENAPKPGKTYRVDAEEFTEMRRAVLLVLPSQAPGIAPKDLIARPLPPCTLVAQSLKPRADGFFQ